MSKIALITDQHFGVRNDNQAFLDYFEEFYNEIFFPYIDKHGITTIIDLGDTFDRRKYVSFHSLYRAQKMFFDEIDKRDIDFHVLVGNHDTYYKNTNEVNSPELLLKEKYPKFHIYSSPAEIEIDGMSSLMMPWICPANQDECLELVHNSKARIMFSHLELSGFQMYKGQFSMHGLEMKTFDKFESVLSGHYHHKSSKGNIDYLGSPYEMTWGDYDDDRGFHILDTETLDLEYVKNPYKMFYKIKYNDEGVESYKDLLEDLCLRFDDFTDRFVKLIITNKTNAYWFDQLVDEITSAGVFNLQVVEDHMYMDLEDDVDILAGTEDTITILSKYVNQLEISAKSKKKVDRLVKELYNEALTIA